jgi:hypothetical protein
MVAHQPPCNNFFQHCGATGNKGKTKTQHHKQLAILIKEKNPDSEQSEKDVENKITSLERQFCQASDWANNTGQGVDNPGDFEAAIKKGCPLYKELEPIIGDRPNVKPLATNEESDNNLQDGNSPVASQAVLQSINNAAPDSSEEEEDITPNKKKEATVSSVLPKSTGSSNRRLATMDCPSKSKKMRTNNNVDNLLSKYLGDDDEVENPNSFKQLRVREVEAREQEANARMMEAQAVSLLKAKSETDILSIQANATLLQERKKLADEGIDQEEIDALLPLKKSSS